MNAHISSRPGRMIAALAFALLAPALLPLAPVIGPAGAAQTDPCMVTSSADSGAATLRGLLADPSCDTINFGGDYSIALASMLTIERNVVIDGAGHAVVISGDRNGDGEGDTRLLSIKGGVAVTLNNLTLEKGSGSGAQGGAIENYGTLTVTGSTFAGNTAPAHGGAIYNSSGSLAITNSTFVNNSAGLDGGAINNYFGPLTITNSTFVNNSAGGNGGAINNWNATLEVYNSIFVKGSGGVNCTGAASSAAGNLADDASCGTGFTQLESSAILLGALGNYGAGTRTFPLLPGSVGIDAGDSTYCPATDQRGAGRVGICDIGAFESQGFTLAINAGNNQTAPLNSAFASSLEVRISSAHAEPVDGGAVNFAAPAVGASAQLSAGSVVIAAGNASVTASANAVVGSYNVTASTRGGTSVRFSLTNVCHHPLVVTSDAASGPGTLHDLLADTGCDLITFAGDYTIRGGGFQINRPLIIDGGSHHVVINGDTDGNGIGDVRLFQVSRDVPVTLKNLVLEKGYHSTEGGGIRSEGVLTVTNCTLTQNHADYYGGGIFSSNRLTVTDSTFIENEGSNGAIWSESGELAITNSTFSRNWGYSITNFAGTMKITNITCIGNGTNIVSLAWARTTVTNSILVRDPVSKNCYTPEGSTLSGMNNLSDDASCGTGFTQLSTDSMLLGTLGDNGGNTQTVPLLPGSPALDAGDSTSCPTTDQRGVTRPQGRGCDIGAFELGPDSAQTGPTFTVNSMVGDTNHWCSQLDCTLREAIEAANNDGVASTVELAPGAVYTVSEVDNIGQGPNGLPQIGTPITINGHGAQITRAAAVPYARFFYVATTGLESASLTLNDVQLENGKVDRNSQDGVGGAILNSGTLIVKNSYLAHNEAGQGAVVYNHDKASFYNSTFYANSSDWGAIVGYGSLDLYNNTFLDNTGVNYAAVKLTSTSSSKFNIYNNLFLSSGSTVPLCKVTVATTVGTLATDSSCQGTVTTYAAIKPLTPDYNGGVTKNMAIQAGSSAIDIGNTTACQNANISNHDQRGYARFVDGNGDKVAQCDVGAFEYGASGPPTATLDPDPPEVSIALTPAAPDGANGWYRSPVTVTPQASDASPVIDVRCALDPASPPAAFDDLPADLCSFPGGAPVSADGEHTFYAGAMDIWGNKSEVVSSSFQIDATPPVITCPVAGPFLLGSGEQAVGPAGVDASASGLDEAASTLSGVMSTESVGPRTLTFTAADLAGNQATQDCSYNVIFEFGGFYPPVEPESALNEVKAGSAVPLKFSLAGDQGLGVIADGYPVSQPVGCDTLEPAGDPVAIQPAGQSGLSYDAETGWYNYVWKTDKAWAGCRALVIQLVDGTGHGAYFQFR